MELYFSTIQKNQWLVYLLLLQSQPRSDKKYSSYLVKELFCAIMKVRVHMFSFLVSLLLMSPCASAPVLTLLYNQLCGEAKYYCSQQSVTSEINLYTCEVLCFRIISGNGLIDSDCSLANGAFSVTSLVPLSLTKTQSTVKSFSIQS